MSERSEFSRFSGVKLENLRLFLEGWLFLDTFSANQKKYQSLKWKFAKFL